MDPAETSGTGEVKLSAPLISPHYLIMMTGRLMPLLALFAATILYAHSLTREDYALYQSVWMYVNLVSVFIGFGVTTVIFSSQSPAFLHFLRNNKKNILIFYGILWVVVFIIFAVASYQYSFLLKIWVIVFMMLQASNTISESWLIKNGGEMRYCITNVIYGSAFLLWHWMVLRSGFDMEWVVKGVCCIAAAKLLALNAYAFRKKQNTHTVITQTNLLPHWLYNGVNDIISVLSKWIDKLILIYLLTPSEFAIFFNGSIEIPLLSIFIGFTGSLMIVQMAERMRMHQPIVPVFRENFLLLSTISFPLFFFLFFFSEPVFLLFFGPQYMTSVSVFTITILILPLRVNTYGGMLQVLGKGNLVTRGSVIDLAFCTALILVLFPLLGMRGAAIASVISTTIQIAFYLSQSKNLLKTSWKQMIPFEALISRFIFCGALFWLLSLAFTTQTPVTKIFAGCFLMLICTLITGRKYFMQILRAKKTS